MLHTIPVSRCQAYRGYVSYLIIMVGRVPVCYHSQKAAGLLLTTPPEEFFL